MPFLLESRSVSTSHHVCPALVFEFSREVASFRKALSAWASLPAPQFSPGCPENVSPVTPPGLLGGPSLELSQPAAPTQTGDTEFQS